jgi:hypothetical protein
MGLILDTNDPILGLEERRESFMVMDLKRQYPSEHGGEYWRKGVLNLKSEHIFSYGDGEIEISKEFLRKMLSFFDDPQNRKRLEEGYKHAGLRPVETAGVPV